MQWKPLTWQKWFFFCWLGIVLKSTMLTSTSMMKVQRLENVSSSEKKNKIFTERNVDTMFWNLRNYLNDLVLKYTVEIS